MILSPNVDAFGPRLSAVRIRGNNDHLPVRVLALQYSVFVGDVFLVVGYMDKRNVAFALVNALAHATLQLIVYDFQNLLVSFGRCGEDAGGDDVDTVAATEIYFVNVLHTCRIASIACMPDTYVCHMNLRDSVRRSTHSVL